MAGISITPDSGTEFNATAAEHNSICRMDDNTFVVAYRDNGDGNKGKVNAGTISGTSISVDGANAVVFNNDTTDTITVSPMSSTKFAISYRESNSNRAYVVIGTISGVTVTLGTPVIVAASVVISLNYGVGLAVLDDSNIVACLGPGGDLDCYVGSVSGTVITFGTTQKETSSIYVYRLSAVGLDSTHFFVHALDNAEIYTVVASVDTGAKTITYGTHDHLSGTTIGIALLTKFTSQHVVIGYQLTTGGYTDLYLTGVSINLGTMRSTFGSTIKTSTNTTDQAYFSICAVNGLSFVVAYYTTTGTQGEVRAGTTDGATGLAWDAQGAQIFDNSTCSYTGLCRMTDDYFILGYKSG